MSNHIGLIGKSPKDLNELMIDCLRHPNYSQERLPVLPENVEWLAACSSAWKECQPKEAYVSPHKSPPNILFGRLSALWKAGATLPPEWALVRCGFRRDYDCSAALFKAFPLMNANPSSSAGTPILNRLAYQGPDSLFNLFLDEVQKRAPDDLLRKDQTGYSALQYAVRAGSMKRSGSLMQKLRPDWEASFAKKTARAYVAQFKATKGTACKALLDEMSAFITSAEESKELIQNLPPNGEAVTSRKRKPHL